MKLDFASVAEELYVGSLTAISLHRAARQSEARLLVDLGCPLLGGQPEGSGRLPRRGYLKDTRRDSGGQGRG